MRFPNSKNVIFIRFLLHPNFSTKSAGMPGFYRVKCRCNRISTKTTFLELGSPVHYSSALGFPRIYSMLPKNASRDPWGEGSQLGAHVSNWLQSGGKCHSSRWRDVPNSKASASFRIEWKVTTPLSFSLPGIREVPWGNPIGLRQASFLWSEESSRIFCPSLLKLIRGVVGDGRWWMHPKVNWRPYTVQG